MVDMTTPRKFRRNLEPLADLIIETYNVSPTTTHRAIVTFEKHLKLVEGRTLPRIGKYRRYMVDAELWAVFVKSYDQFKEKNFETFDLALAELYSGDLPEVRSLQDVYEVLSRERELSSDVYARVADAIRQQDELHAMATGQTEATAALVEGQARSAELLAELDRRLTKQGETIDYLLQGTRLFAEMLTEMRVQITEAMSHVTTD